MKKYVVPTRCKYTNRAFIITRSLVKKQKLLCWTKTATVTFTATINTNHHYDQHRHHKRTFVTAITTEKPKPNDNKNTNKQHWWAHLPVVPLTFKYTGSATSVEQKLLTADKSTTDFRTLIGKWSIRKVTRLTRERRLVPTCAPTHSNTQAHTCSPHKHTSPYMSPHKHTRMISTTYGFAFVHISVSLV